MDENADVVVADATKKLSLWLTNPAKAAFRWIGVLMALATSVATALARYTDQIPEAQKPLASKVLVGCGVVSVVGLKVTTWLIAHGYGPASNGKNGAWAPANVYNAVAHAQEMSVRKGDSDGSKLPGAPAKDA